MKLHHAAAVALVGWYLMVPPYDPKTKDFDTSAPLSKWFIRSAHDTANSGQDSLEAGWKTAEKKKDERTKARLAPAQCVATDDPGLAK